MKKYLLIDVGGSAIKYAVCDEQLSFSSHGKAPSYPHADPEIFCKSIKDVYDSIQEEVAGICISMPGRIDRKSGFCSGSSMLSATNINVVELLQEKLKKPVSALNDGYAAAMGELGYGNLKGIDNGAVIVLGTGIGGGLIINGDLFTGNNNSAGNLSFLYSNIDQPENMDYMFASLNGIKGLQKAIEQTSGLKEIDGLKAFQLIRDGNKDVERGLELFCDHLAYQIGNLQALLDLDRVVIGGGISNEPLLIEYIRAACQRREQVRMVFKMPEIMTCLHNNDANLFGALYNFRQNHPEI